MQLDWEDTFAIYDSNSEVQVQSKATINKLPDGLAAIGIQYNSKAMQEESCRNPDVRSKRGNRNEPDVLFP